MTGTVRNDRGVTGTVRNDSGVTGTARNDRGETVCMPGFSASSEPAVSAVSFDLGEAR